MAQSKSPAPPQDLGQALRRMCRHPVRALVPPWSWKAAVFTAVLRSFAFFITNVKSGRGEAAKAMVVEAVFALFAGGLIGAISQQLRDAAPLWATAILVWAGLPGLMLLAQAEVHHLAGTPHLSGGLVMSFCFASAASAFTWYAMRHGAMLGGVDETAVLEDMKALPRISLDFLLATPRLVKRVFAANRRGKPADAPPARMTPGKSSRT